MWKFIGNLQLTSIGEQDAGEQLHLMLARNDDLLDHWGSLNWNSLLLLGISLILEMVLTSLRLANKSTTLRIGFGNTKLILNVFSTLLEFSQANTSWSNITWSNAWYPSHACHVYNMECSWKLWKFKGLVILTTLTTKLWNPQNLYISKLCICMKMRSYPMVNTHAVNVCECVRVCMRACVIAD